MMLKVLIMLFIVRKCGSIIYELNEAEYDRMPALFGLEGDYERCLRRAGGVYCIAAFDLVAGPGNDLMNLIREYSQHDLRHYNHSKIHRAVCVTLSCKEFIQNKNLSNVADLEVVLERCINESIQREYGLEVKLNQIYSCDKHGDRADNYVGDWILALILLSLLIMNIIGSVYDVWYEKPLQGKCFKAGNPYLLSFSVFRNWKQLSCTDIDPRFERLRGLHGLKSIIIFFVASSHVMWLLGTGFTDNPRDFEMASRHWHYQLIFSGMVIVQIFFVISGCLLSYSLQLESERKDLSWKLIPKILLLRWMRLAPAIMVVVLFTGTWLRHAHTGPLWKLSVGSVAHDCQRYWWQHLLAVNNYMQENKACAVQTWHTAAELQLFAVGLVACVATGVRRRRLMLGALALLGVVAPALHVWLQDLDALVMHRPRFYLEFDDPTFRSLHVLGHNNLSCYAVGLALGFLAHHCHTHNIEYRNSKLLKYLTWLMPVGVVALILTGSLFYVDGERPSVGIRMAYAALHRPALGAMVALLVLSVVMKFEDALRGILEWRGWTVTSRLAFGVYLLHVDFIHALLGLRTQLGHVHFYHLIINHLGVVFLSLLVSVPFYVLLEAPMRTLAKKVFTEPSKEEAIRNKIE